MADALSTQDSAVPQSRDRGLRRRAILEWAASQPARSIEPVPITAQRRKTPLRAREISRRAADPPIDTRDLRPIPRILPSSAPGELIAPRGGNKVARQRSCSRRRIQPWQLQPCKQSGIAAGAVRAIRSPACPTPCNRNRHGSAYATAIVEPCAARNARAVLGGRRRRHPPRFR